MSGRLLKCTVFVSVLRGAVEMCSICVRFNLRFMNVREAIEMCSICVSSNLRKVDECQGGLLN